MSNQEPGLFSCNTASWIFAIILGVLVAVLSNNALGWTWLVCLVLGLVAALIAGWILTNYFCSDVEHYDDLSRTADAEVVADVAPAAVASAAAVAEPDMPEGSGARDESGWQGQGNDLARQGADADRAEQGKAAKQAEAQRAEAAAAEKAAVEAAAAEKAAAEAAAAEKAAAEADVSDDDTDKASPEEVAQMRAKRRARRAAVQTEPETQVSSNVASDAPADGARDASASAGQPQLYSDAPSNADDLKQLKGVGPGLEKTLNGLGIYTLAQIADWTAEHITWVDGNLKFKGRIERDDWVGQARILARGGDTEFSKRVDSGDVEY